VPHPVAVLGQPLLDQDGQRLGRGAPDWHAIGDLAEPSEGRRAARRTCPCRIRRTPRLRR
jgi:hypothetical protein